MFGGDRHDWKNAGRCDFSRPGGATVVTPSGLWLTPDSHRVQGTARCNTGRS